MLIFKSRPRKTPNLSETITPSQRCIMNLMGSAMDQVRAQVVRDEKKIMDALLHDPTEKVMNIVSPDPWLDTQEKLETELRGELLDAGRRVKLPSIKKATLTYSFDADRPEAGAWAAKEAGNLIRQVVDEQRAMVREYVERSTAGEFTVTQVARGLRDVVGLTSQQSGWVENFRSREILAQMNAGNSFDEAYSLSEKRTAAYQKRIHKYRTETIARTETIRASSEGRQQAWAQGLEQGFISRFALKQWIAEFDACDICAPLGAMDPIPITDQFPEGEPPAHPNCRCDVLLIDDIDLDEDLDAFFEEQPVEISDSSLPIDGDMRAGETYNNLPRQNEWESSMSEDERDALSSYTGKGGKFSADELNDRIRFGNLTDEQAVKVGLIDSSIARAESLGIKTTTPLYRGQEIELTGPSIGMSDDAVRQRVYETALERYPIGSEVNLGRGSFISTSTDTTPALDASASRRSPGIIFEIKPTAGAPMQGVTKYDDEYEILLPRDKKFQVLDIHRDQVILDSALAERIRTVVQLQAIE